MSAKIDDRPSANPPPPAPAGASAPPAAAPEDRDRFRQILGRSDSRERDGRSGSGSGGSSPADLLASRFEELMSPRKRGPGGGPGTSSGRPDQLDEKEPGTERERSRSDDGRDAPAPPAGHAAGPGAPALAGEAFPVQAAGPALGPGDIDALVESLVSRMLVSAPGAAQSEVRLTLGPDTLPATTIRLVRGADGMLAVTITAGRPDSFQTLVAAQGPLREALEKMENGPVRVTVAEGGAGAEDDSSRRSRGRYVAEADPEDGGGAPGPSGGRSGRFDPEAGG